MPNIYKLYFIDRKVNETLDVDHKIVPEGGNHYYSQYLEKPRPHFGKNVLVPVALLESGPCCNSVVLDAVAAFGVGSSWRGGSHPTNAVSSRVRVRRAGHLISGMAPDSHLGSPRGRLGGGGKAWSRPVTGEVVGRRVMRHLCHLTMTVVTCFGSTSSPPINSTSGPSTSI